MLVQHHKLWRIWIVLIGLLLLGGGATMVGGPAAAAGPGRPAAQNANAHKL